MVLFYLFRCFQSAKDPSPSKFGSSTAPVQSLDMNETHRDSNRDACYLKYGTECENATVINDLSIELIVVVCSPLGHLAEWRIQSWCVPLKGERPLCLAFLAGRRL